MSAGPNPYTPGAAIPSNPAVEQEIQKKATTALIAALLGFFCCPLIHIYAIMTANDVLAQIQQTGVGQQHQTLATIAKIVAIVHGCIVIAVLLLYIVIIALGIGAAAVGN
ncbi:MAG: hypothetical protein L0211_18080 [Planctomycetaceae bacterium]|nr:hypothetical protein [Planctomycetaceae bacterium]